MVFLQNLRCYRGILHIVLFLRQSRARTYPDEVRHATELWIPPTSIVDMGRMVYYFRKTKPLTLWAVFVNYPALSTELTDLIIKISGGHAGALAGLVETIITDNASTCSILSM